MIRVSKTGISNKVRKLKEEGFTQVSKVQGKGFYSQTLHNAKTNETVTLRYTSNGWLSIS